MWRDADILGQLRGRFIVLDGPDGAGKTTLLGLVAERLRSAGLCATLCKDPGGSDIGNRIRSVLLDFDLSRMNVRCETLLFMASRAQLVHEVIRPALAEGHVALCDRFVSSTCAYQVAAGNRIETILDLAGYAIEHTWPDLTLILDVPVELGFERIACRNAGANGRPGKGNDSMERRPRAFHERVRQHFLELQDRYPGPVQVANASQPVDAVLETVMDRLKEYAARSAGGDSSARVLRDSDGQRPGWASTSVAPRDAVGRLNGGIKE